jgi:hypothetical protein
MIKLVTVIVGSFALATVALGKSLRAADPLRTPRTHDEFMAQMDQRDGESLSSWFARRKRLHVLDCAKKGIWDGQEAAYFKEELCAERKHPFGPYRTGIKQYCWESNPEWHKGEGRACVSMKKLCKEKNTLKRMCERSGHHFGP